jgi:hypothetical protein
MAAATTVGRRFTQLIQHLGISKNAFAISLDKTATVIQHLVDERNKPGYDLLCKVFEVYPQVSRDWLLLGQGPMLATPAPALTVAPPQPAPQAAPPPAELSLPFALPATPDAVAEKAAPKEVAPSSAAPNEVAGLLPAPVHSSNAEAVLTAALHAQHLQHQLALAEQRNQHLLEQQRLMQQLIDVAQRR